MKEVYKGHNTNIIQQQSAKWKIKKEIHLYFVYRYLIYVTNVPEEDLTLRYHHCNLITAILPVTKIIILFDFKNV